MSNANLRWSVEHNCWVEIDEGQWSDAEREQSYNSFMEEARERHRLGRRAQQDDVRQNIRDMIASRDEAMSKRNIGEAVRLEIAIGKRIAWNPSLIEPSSYADTHADVDMKHDARAA